MPRVTAIEPQKKTPDRFNLYLDGQFAFGLDVNTLVRNRLKVGLNLTNDQVDKIIKESNSGRLFDLSLRFLASRPKSEKEVFDYLAKKVATREGIKYAQAKKSPLISQVILKLKKYKYINDLEFAKWWVRSRVKSKPKGLRFLKMELLEKGIGKDLTSKLIGNIDQNYLAKKAVTAKVKKWQNLPMVDFKKKFWQFLLSRGFDFETVKETFAFFAKKR